MGFLCPDWSAQALYLTVLMPLLASDPLSVPVAMPADRPLKGHLLHDERKNSSPHSQCHPSLHRFGKGKWSLISDLAHCPLNPVLRPVISALGLH